LTGITTMLVKIQGLDRFTEELQEMAADVAKIAAQANLLSLNAAIEAARAGEMGVVFPSSPRNFACSRTSLPKPVVTSAKRLV